MLSTARSRAVWQISRTAHFSARRAYSFSANDKQEINTPANSSKPVPNVSKTNELPIETPQGDAALQENAVDAEKLRVQQAPNRAAVWSRSQNPRAKAMSGPRFEQTIMELQVQIVPRKLGFLEGEFFGELEANSIYSLHPKLQSI